MVEDICIHSYSMRCLRIKLVVDHVVGSEVFTLNDNQPILARCLFDFLIGVRCYHFAYLKTLDAFVGDCGSGVGAASDPVGYHASVLLLDTNVI